MNRKKDQTFLTFWSGDMNPRFLVIFLPIICIFMESKEPEIKPKKASKRNRTLSKLPENAGVWKKNGGSWTDSLKSDTLMKELGIILRISWAVVVLGISSPWFLQPINFKKSVSKQCPFYPVSCRKLN